MRDKRTLLIGTIVGLVVLVVLLGAVLLVFHNRRQQGLDDRESDNIQQQIDNELSDIDPETDFEPFNLEDVDPGMSVEEEVDFTLESIDLLLRDIDSQDFGELEEINW